MNQNNELPNFGKLIEKIKQAFAGTPFPGNENIIGNPDHVAICEECKDWEDDLANKKWEGFAENEYEFSVGGAMCFLSDVAWHYFLPAYLIESIQAGHFDHFHLRKESDPELIGYQQNRHNKLSIKQCQIAREYLQVGLERHGSADYFADEYRDAIEYWEERIQAQKVKESR
ncbi:MAG: DUF6714 family protein [Acidobacteriota bacterium]|nr:DUF6714 family protein [Acidobacteriota bacterium]